MLAVNVFGAFISQFEVLLDIPATEEGLAGRQKTSSHAWPQQAKLVQSENPLSEILQ